MTDRSDHITPDGPRSASWESPVPDAPSGVHQNGPTLEDARKVAHDVNNLIYVAYANLDLLGELPLGAAGAELVAEAKESVMRASGLLRGLVTTPADDPEATLSIDELVRGLQPVLAALLPAEVSVVFELSSGAIIRATRSAIERIIMNLVVNARDAMPSGGRLTIATRERRAIAGLQVELLICDSGSGMVQAVLDRAFDPDFSTKVDHSGSGLGLDIVRRLAEQLGGSIHVESIAGQGTEVGVRLPVYARERRAG